MKALSLRQPWAFAITHLGKRLENRTWKHLKNNNLRAADVQLGDTIALHASSTKPGQHDIDGVLGAAYPDLPHTAPQLPELAFKKGALIGTFVLRGIVRTDEKCTIVDGTQDKPFPHYVVRPEDFQMFLKAYGDPGEERQREQIKRWWLGPYALWVDDVMVFPEPVEDVKGMLGFWEILKTDMLKVEAQIAKATPAELPDWYRRSYQIAAGHDTVVNIVEDPAMSPGTMKIKSGKAEQLVLFGDPPKKERRGLH